MNPTERASFRTLAQHELDHLHECPVCIGTREDLHEGAPDGTPCQRCGGTGRWDDRAPLARAVLTLLDALDTAYAEASKTFPIIQHRDWKTAKPSPLQVPWSVAEKAYSVYAARHGLSQSLEDLARRGGFGVEEMDLYHPAWREEVSEIAALKAKLDAADREIARLQAGIYTRDQRIAQHCAEAAAAMAENKRMREALERIRDSDDVRDWAQNVAAEALGGQPT